MTDVTTYSVTSVCAFFQPPQFRDMVAFDKLGELGSDLQFLLNYDIVETTFAGYTRDVLLG
jgi:hypothetical protein